MSKRRSAADSFKTFSKEKLLTIVTYLVIIYSYITIFPFENMDVYVSR
jgi:hypothetical protein